MNIIILAWCGTFFDIIFLIPQIIKVIKLKDCRDLSLLTTIFTFIAGILWIIYGIHFQQTYLYVSNIFVSAFALILFIYQLLWNKNQRNKQTTQNLVKLKLSDLDKLIKELESK